MAWAITDDIRLLTGLTESDIGEDNLESLIDVAQKEVLMHINNNVVREQVEYIDDTRTNDINGVNTTFYIKNWYGKFISDYNYDLVTNTSDITLVSVDSIGVESLLQISSIDADSCKFVTSTAPEDVTLLVSYAYSYFDTITPNPLLALASNYLAASYSYMRINSSQQKQVKFGNVSITNSVGQDGAASTMYNKYLDIMKQLQESTSGGAIWGISKVLI